MGTPTTLLLGSSVGGVSPGSRLGFQSREWGLQSRASISLLHTRADSLRFAARPHSLTADRHRRFRCNGVLQGGEGPPESREEAIEQAAGSVAGLLEKVLRRRGPATVKQQRKEQRQVNLRVEIPVLDDTPSSLVTLTLDFLSALLTKWRGRYSPELAIFFRDASTVELVRTNLPNVSFHSLESSERGVASSAVVVVAGAKYDDIDYLQELVRSVTPTPVVVLNPEWSPEDENDAPFLRTFESAYAFIPLAIQGFFSKTEGAVLKNVQSGAPGGCPWLIFVKDEGHGSFTRLSSLKTRPGPAELESALYNAMAANSPVTKSIKFLRGLVSKE